MNAFHGILWRDSRHVAVSCDGNMYRYKHLDFIKFHGMCAAKTGLGYTEAFESSRMNGLVWELWLIECYTDVSYCVHLNQCARTWCFCFSHKQVGMAHTTVKQRCDVSLAINVLQVHIVCRRKTSLIAGGPLLRVTAALPMSTRCPG
jgi:hypothetical protein